MYGLMGNPMKATGRRARWRDLATSSGQMGSSTSVNLYKTNSTARGNTFGTTDEFTSENGFKASSTTIKAS